MKIGNIISYKTSASGNEDMYNFRNRNKKLTRSCRAFSIKLRHHSVGSQISKEGNKIHQVNSSSMNDTGLQSLSTTEDELSLVHHT